VNAGSDRERLDDVVRRHDPPLEELGEGGGVSLEGERARRALETLPASKETNRLEMRKAAGAL